MGGIAGGMIGPGGGMVSSRGDNNGITFTYNFPKGAMTMSAVTGAPYAGHTSSQSIRTLANGTHLIQPPFEQPMTYRDSMGRTRTDLTMQRRPAGINVANLPPQIMRLAEIDDPVAGYRYILDQVHQIAHRVAVQTRQNQAPFGGPAMAARVMAAQPSRTMPNGITMKVDDLGTQEMSGITVSGRRTTNTYPVGTYQGNDAPVTTVDESWQAVQYGFVMLSKNTGPESESTTTMKDFSKEEPDPALFQVPAGYQIVDETGEFTITIPRNAQ